MAVLAALGRPRLREGAWVRDLEVVRVLEVGCVQICRLRAVGRREWEEALEEPVRGIGRDCSLVQAQQLAAVRVVECWVVVEVMLGRDHGVFLREVLGRIAGILKRGLQGSRRMGQDQ